MADHPTSSRLPPPLQALLSPRGRWVVAWLTALVATVIAVVSSWTWGSLSTRRDGNHGHKEIDFGGQWVMARMIVEGHGAHLYDRNRVREVLEKGYPRGNEDPKEETTDAEDLLGAMSDLDTPAASAVTGSFVAPLAARDSLGAAAFLAAGHHHWTDERIASVTRTPRGGALYPPTQAVLFAPLACLPPQPAYRAMQLLGLLLTFAAAWALARLSEGRVWWPVAITALMMFPGYGGSLNIGQNSMLSLALLIFGWWAFANDRDALGGACWGLLAFKPVWAVAFFPVLLLTRRWRAAAAMALTGGGLALLTLPVVGWHSWMDWREIGKDATKGYAYYKNWVFLSRDLVGIPRRYLLDFDEYVSRNPEAWLPTLIGRAMQIGALLCALILSFLRPTEMRALRGPGPAFALLSGWLSCFHFMYYDVLLAALPVYLLFMAPARYFAVRFWPSPPPPEEVPYYCPSLDAPLPPLPRLAQGGPYAVVNPLPPTVLTLICVLPQLAALVTGKWEFPPFDTYGLLVLWGWSGWHVLRRSWHEP